MSLLEKMKSAFGASEQKTAEQTAKPQLPSLDELRQMIIQSQMLFRQSLAEAESSAKKSQELYRSQFTATPAQRARLMQAQADQDQITRRKMAHAQLAGRNTAMLQDVEVVFKIEEAFRAAGLMDARETGTLPEIQKELNQASYIVGNAMDAINRIGSSIQTPTDSVANTPVMDPEVAALWAEFDKETDQAKKLEIQMKIEAKNTNKPAQVTLGAI